MPTKQYTQARRGLMKLLSAAVAIGLSTSACQHTGMGPTTASSASGGSAITSVDFTSTPAPSSEADLLTTSTASSAIVRYADGSIKTYPLSYNVLFKNTDKVGSNPYEAARLYDAKGVALNDLNGDPVIAETPDANSLLSVDDKLFLVTHYEYDWLLGNGEQAKKAKGWYSRMPMSMTVTDIEQDSSGMLKAIDQRPADFSEVGGLWIPCFGSQTPWNTHLGSEEDYDLYYTEVSGKSYSKATKGIKALSEVYFNGERQANPYDYGYITEVVVQGDGSSTPIKHYSMGRGTWEMAQVMPDQRTAYFGDDGAYVGMFMSVADKAGDLSANTLYAARWYQAGDNGGNLGWIKLGHATNDEIRQIIDSGVTFGDIFETTTADANPNWKTDGFKMIRAGHKGTEILKLKPGMEQAAAFLEARRYAALLDATTEFNKMEGVAVDPKAKNLYMAISYQEKGMLSDPAGPADHIQLNKIKAGATYQIALNSGQVDSNGQRINSEWVGTAMHAPAGLTGEDMKADALGNIAVVDKVANPDNVFFSNKMRTLFIGEDSGTHVNNFVWAYNVDTGKLTRIMSLASGSESTGLQVVDDVNGHAYIMSNNQHQGEWLKTMPKDVKSRLSAAAKKMFGSNSHGALKYQQEANVGYIGGLPGIN